MLTPISNRGHIMKNASRLIAVGAAVTLLPLAAALAQSPTPDPARAPPDQTQPPQQSRGASFESLDANGDGRISREEAESNAGVKEQFSRYDVNGDGFIERAEVNQANDSQSQPPKQQ